MVGLADPDRCTKPCGSLAHSRRFNQIVSISECGIIAASRMARSPATGWLAPGQPAFAPSGLQRRFRSTSLELLTVNDVSSTGGSSAEISPSKTLPRSLPARGFLYAGADFGSPGAPVAVAGIADALAYTEMEISTAGGAAAPRFLAAR